MAFEDEYDYRGGSMDTKVVAELVIRGAGKMSAERRKDVAAWLRLHAKELNRKGDQYAPTFRGRYHLPKTGR